MFRKIAKYLIAPVLVAIIAPFAISYMNQLKYPFIPSETSKAIKGRWEGEVIEEAIPSLKQPEIRYRIVVNFDTKWSRGLLAKGEAMSVKENIELPFKAEGGIYQNNYVRMTYEQLKNGEYTSFGVFIVQLKETNLTGTFTGLGFRSNRIIRGTLKLHKV